MLNAVPMALHTLKSTRTKEIAVKNDRKWNTITLAVWFFVFVYFGLSYALAEEPTDDELENTVLQTAYICASVYDHVAQSLSEPGLKYDALAESEWWVGFLQGWTEFDESVIRMGMSVIKKEMVAYSDNYVEFNNVMNYCRNMANGLEELLEEEGD